jgi:alpha-1,6-mannosyltransferase
MVIPALTRPAPAEPGAVRDRTFRLGLVGSLLVLVGGLGVGATLERDPLLSNTVLGIWRYGHGKMVAGALLYTGIGLLVWAWIRLGRAVRSGQVDVAGVVRTAAWWAAPLLLAPPLFTRDPYIYLAQGALAAAGFDPYTTGPNAITGPMTDNVADIWLSTPSPYGPLFILLLKSVVSVTGTHVLLGVLLTRLVLVSGLVLLCAALPGLSRHLGGRPAVALWLAVANPFTLVHLVGGMHNDVLMIGLLCTGTLAVLDRRHVVGFALVGAAVAVKVTAAVALPFLVWVWVAHRKGSSRVGSFALAAGVGVVVVSTVFGAFTLLAGVDLGWLGALNGNTVVDLWISLPTAAGKIVSGVAGLFVDVNPAHVVGVVRVVGWFVLAGVVGWLWWQSREGGPTAIRNAAFALLATVLLSAVTFSWYFSWPLVLAAGFAIPQRRIALIGGCSVWLILNNYPGGDTVQNNWPLVVVTTAVAIYVGTRLRAEQFGAEQISEGSETSPA